MPERDCKKTLEHFALWLLKEGYLDGLDSEEYESLVPLFLEFAEGGEGGA